MPEIIAHRAWGLVKREGIWLLQPVANRLQTWLGPAVAAQERPGKYNSSGIHAYKERILVEFDYSELPVIGTVQLYGHVVEHRFGYRAEKAIVRSLELQCEAGTNPEDHYVRFNVVFEKIAFAIERGPRSKRDSYAVGSRPAGQGIAVGRLVQSSESVTMKTITEAKAALEKRYQVDVTVNINNQGAL